jgi:vancomycin resistance protein VanJ
MRVYRTSTNVIVLTAGILLLAGGCAHTPRPAVRPPGPHFTVMTFNVNYGGPRPDLAAAAIASSGADVVCLQESSPAWERYLRPRLQALYPHIHFRHEPAAGGSAVLSRWPLREVAYVAPDEDNGGWFPALIVNVDTPAGPVQVAYVHLRPPVSDTGSVASGYFTTPAVRRSEIEHIHAHAEPGVPTVVVGDFNEEPHGRAVSWLRGRGYQDALRQFDPYASTWRWQLGPIPLRRRMDHILASPELRCHDARVLRAGASDHLPVVATFQGAG